LHDQKLLKCQEKPSDVYKMQDNAWRPGLCSGPCCGSLSVPKPYLVGRRTNRQPPQEPHPRSRRFQASGFGPRLSPPPNFQIPSS